MIGDEFMVSKVESDVLTSAPESYHCHIGLDAERLSPIRRSTHIN